MPQDAPPGFTAIDDSAPPGFSPIKAAPPDPYAKQSKAAALAAGVQNPGVSMPPLKPAMEAAGMRHMQNEERLGQYQDFAAHSPTPVSNASLLYPAVELPNMLRRGSELISKPFSRLSLANEWKVPGLPIKVNLKAPPLTDRLGNELNIPGIESEMQTDIAEGRLQRAAARDSMYKELGQIRAAALPPATPELGSPGNPGWVAKLPDRMPQRLALPPELGSPANPGWLAKLPDRMPERVALPPELGSPENPGWMSKLSNRMPKPPSTDAKFLRELPRQGLTLPGEGEGPIGSNPIERRIQTTASKAIVTPEEYAQSVRDLGSRARMLPGEGEAEWRARVTGLLKAARGRTK
jgi:hypothetical protein